LAAHIEPGGDLLIEGQDLGPKVEELLGAREYEWTVRVVAADLAALASALGGVPGPECRGSFRERCLRAGAAILAALERRARHLRADSPVGW
jgi:hypothetical protein